MARQPYPGFCDGDYQLSTPNASADICMNLYPEAIQSKDGKNTISLVNRPGTSAFGTLAAGNIRCLWAGDNRAFAMSGNAPTKLYEVFSNGTSSVSVTLNSSLDTRAGQIVSNGTQLLLRDGTKLWVDDGTGIATQVNLGASIGTVDTSGAAVTWASGSTFASWMVGETIFISGVPYVVLSVTDSTHLTLTTSAGVQVAAAFTMTEYLRVVSIAFLDGYFIALRLNTNDIYVSDYQNGLVWSPLEFATRTGQSDRMVAIYSLNGQLWMMGQKTIEVWANTGNADFPFQRIDGSTINVGVLARDSVQQVGETLMWVGGNMEGSGSVYMAEGYNPRRVSTYPIELYLQDYDHSVGINTAVAYAYQENGHQFYILNLPTANNTTLGYDTTMNYWHQRAVGTSLTVAQPWQYHCFAFTPGRHLVGDASSAAIYQMQWRIYSDTGSAQFRKLRQAPHICKTLTWLFYRMLQVDMQMGNFSTGTINLEISRDGGNTFGTAKSLTFGGSSNYTWRAIWWRLGRARDAVFKVYTDDSRLVSIVDAYLDISEGNGT